MSLQSLAIDWAVQLALTLTLAGLLSSGRWRQARSFVVYLATVLIAEFTVIFWPATFWTFDWHVTRQLAYSTLKIALAAELAVGIFAAFPGAHRAARGVVMAGILAMFAVVVLAPPSLDHSEGEMFMARMANGALWLFTGLAAVAYWYVIPLRQLQKAILGGYAVFGVLSVASLRFAHQNAAVTLAMPYAYLVLCSYWAWTAWTVKDPVDAPALDALLARAR